MNSAKTPLQRFHIMAAIVCAVLIGYRFGLGYALVMLFALSNTLQFSVQQLGAASLSTAEIVVDVMQAFKGFLPMLKTIGTDMSSGIGVYNQQIIARITTLPSVQTYDAANGGYMHGVVGANTLVTDVPITLDQHKHVPINITYLNSISTKRDLYKENIGNLGYVLAKHIIDFALGKVVAANFSHSSTVAIADTSRDTLGTVRKQMNINKAAPGRVGLVNSDFFEQLDSDSRIASRDFYGLSTGGKALGVLNNVAGFSSIWEYPDLPANGENLSAFFFDSRAISIATRIPNDIEKVAAAANVPKIANFEVITDPDTGFSLLAITWMNPGTFDVYVTVTALFGAVAGSQGGDDDTLTDRAGYRIVTE